MKTSRTLSCYSIISIVYWVDCFYLSFMVIEIIIRNKKIGQSLLNVLHFSQCWQYSEQKEEPNWNNMIKWEFICGVMNISTWHRQNKGITIHNNNILIQTCKYLFIKSISTHIHASCECMVLFLFLENTLFPPEIQHHCGILPSRCMT